VSLQVLTFRAGNRAGLLNPAPAVEAAMVTFICASPASMSMSPVYGALRAVPPCLLPQHSKQLVRLGAELLLLMLCYAPALTWGVWGMHDV